MTEEVAGMMLTNPNTLGIFEKQIQRIAEVVHAKGGLLYMDGANMNALVGVAQPGALRRGRDAPEPAQDLLHPAWRRRAGLGTRGRQEGSGALPALSYGGEVSRRNVLLGL